MVSKPVAIEERLRDIIKWGESLARHTGGITQSQFMADEKTQHAATKCIEAIGEAAKEILKTEPDFDSHHPGLKAKAVARWRRCRARPYNPRGRHRQESPRQLRSQ